MDEHRVSTLTPWYPASRAPAGQRRRPSARIEGAVLRVVCPSCLQASFSTSKALPVVGHVANVRVGSRWCNPNARKVNWADAGGMLAYKDGERVRLVSRNGRD